MTPERDPFDELKAALDVEPSAGFASRVRGRTEVAGTNTRWVRWVAPLAVAAMVIVLVRPTRMEDEPLGVVETTLGDAEVATYPREYRAVPRVAPAVQPAKELVSVATADKVVETHADGRLDVVTNQPDVLRRLWAKAAEWDVVESEVIVPQAAAGDVPLPVPMTVTPIVVAPIVVDVAASGGAGGRLPVPPAFVARGATRSQ